MEMIKNIVSGGHEKEDASHAGGSNIPGVHNEGEHPIYDQMKSPTKSSFGEFTDAKGHAPYSSNTADGRQSAPGTTTGTSGTQSATSTLRPDSTQSRPGAPSDGTSSASIKSGVIGFPQGSQDKHAALGNAHPDEQNLAGNQVAGGGNQPGSSNYRAENDRSHLGGITANASAGALAGNQLHSKTEDSAYNTSRSGEQQPFEKSLNQPTASSGTERSFPLAGGVTGHRPLESTALNERQPGTKEREAGLQDSQGRQGLAGAAAAATASSEIPGHRHETARETPSTGTGFQNTRQTGQGPHTDAMAATTAAASNTRSVPSIGQEHARTTSASSTDPATHKSGLFDGPFTEGPHSTDTANMFDPHLHVPGEFPSPTPVEEPTGSSYMFGKGSTAAGGSHELRHTGTLDGSQTTSADRNTKPTSEHHPGRDAAVAGGLGAAGAGAYAAGKYHNEPSEAGGDLIPSDRSPYSSSKIDSRVDSKPITEQRYDATTTAKPQARDPTLTSGASQPTSLTKDENSQHHHGRDAALVGGAGAATTAGLYASQRKNEPDSGPASETIGPHKSNALNVLDPRVQPDPNLQKHHEAAPTANDPASSTVGPHKSNVANVMDPRVLPDPAKQKAAPKEDRHHGRDAAVVGGTGAAGAGAYEAVKSYDNHRGTQPAASMNEQRYDPTVSSSHDHTSTTAPGIQDPEKSQHHYGRDAAVVGGLGAAGAGTYAATRGNDHSQQLPGASQQYPSTATHQHNVGGQQYSPTGTRQTSLGQQQPSPTQTSQRAPLAQDPQQSQHHYGRDAAVVGGLGAAGAGTYAAARGNDPHSQQSPVNQQQPSTQASGFRQTPLSQVQQQSSADSGAHQRYDSVQDPKARNQHPKRDAAALGAAGAVAGAGGAYAYSQHDANKEREAAQKVHQEQLKDQQKQFASQQKEQEKAYHDQQKHQDKLAAAEDKKHQHQVEKELKQQEHDDESKEKKHGIFGFLHRDKDKKRETGETSPRASGENNRHSKEYAAAGVGAAGIGAGAYEAHEHDGRNKLHKDPPKGHPAREAMEHQQHGIGSEQGHYGTDGPIGSSTKVSGDHATQPGVSGAPEPGSQHHTVVEPHTGLPMNVEKYGDGHGGTDGSNTIEGYGHGLSSGERAGQAGQAQHGTTDWDAIKKANTLY